MPSVSPPPSRALILGLADDDGRLDAESLYAAAEAAGLTATTIRLALRRLVEAGLARQSGRGRAATLQLTPAGLATRAPDLTWVAAAYRADAGLDPWDGTWHMVSFEIPETKRAARDALRDQIVGLLGASLGGGLYVSAHAWDAWIEATAAEHDVLDRLAVFWATSFRYRGLSDPRTVASRLWPIDALAAGYDDFAERWIHERNPTNVPDAVRMAFEASAQIEDLLRQDPLLPPALLPTGFRAADARAIYSDLMARLSSEPLIAAASIFTSYQRAIDRALAQSADAFWHDAYAKTASVS